MTREEVQDLDRLFWPKKDGSVDFDRGWESRDEEVQHHKEQVDRLRAVVETMQSQINSLERHLSGRNLDQGHLTTKKRPGSLDRRA